MRLKPNGPPRGGRLDLNRLAALVAELAVRVEAIENEQRLHGLGTISAGITALKAQGKRILMAISQSERTIITAFDAETTRLADMIAGLDRDDPEYNSELNAILDRMRQIGKNPEEPIPPVEE